MADEGVAGTVTPVPNYALSTGEIHCVTLVRSHHLQLMTMISILYYKNLSCK